MNQLDELENNLRQLPDQTSGYRPTQEQLHIILQRRAEGERIVIPATIERALPLSRALLVATGCAAVAAGVILYRGIESRAAGSLWTPGELMAETTVKPEFPVLSTPARPLKQALWLYDADPLDQIRPWDQLFALKVVQSTRQGKAAWMLLAGTKNPDSAPEFSDTTWLARDGLALLDRRRDTAVSVQPIPSLFLAVLQAADLSKDWSASVPIQVRRDGEPKTEWMNLKVYGSEQVETPLGTFECWKVGFSPEIQFYFWVTQEGWPVKQGTGRVDQVYGKMNLLLVNRSQEE